MTMLEWADATRDELAAALPGGVVVIPTGATEQHGHHLATGHDSLTVTAIARRAGERVADDATIILAPTLVFGSSAHHLPLGGTLSLSTETYRRVVSDLVHSVIAAGGRRIMLLNGHGGNRELNELAARDEALAAPAHDPVAIAAASYWEIARAALDADPVWGSIRRPGHAGQFETATMLALQPERMRQPPPARDTDPSRMPGIAGVRIERSGAWPSFDGFTDFPDRATAEDGARALEIVVRAVAEALAAFARQPIPPPGA